MARKLKNGSKGNTSNRAKKKSREKKELKAVKAIQSPDGTTGEKWYYHPVVKPLALIAQIIWIFLDVATLLLRMVIYTFIYDTPHGKHEMMLDTSGARESK